MNVARMHVIITSFGFADLWSARSAIIVVGIIVTPPVFKTKNVIIASLAVSFLGLIFWSSCKNHLSQLKVDQNILNRIW